MYTLEIRIVRNYKNRFDSNTKLKFSFELEFELSNFAHHHYSEASSANYRDAAITSIVVTVI